MTYGFVFPQINARDTTAPKEKDKRRRTINGRLARGNPVAKYDHMAMIKDRLAGMSWESIGQKHNVQHGSGSLAHITRMLVLNSSACLKLPLEKVMHLDAVGYRKPEKP